MKVKLRHLIQDQLAIEDQGLDQATVGFIWDDSRHADDVFLDGPVSTRVAVLDFNTDGLLDQPIPLDRTGKIWHYDAPDDPTDPRFHALSAFAIVHRALAMFEAADTLGRKVEWAFDGPQLLVVPRAGNWRNAYYERDSHSLQFFPFTDDRHPGRVIHTAASLDIVSHETGHAVLDAVAPHLYNCTTPQSLALHEAVADLTALFMAVDIGPLREALLRESRGRIDQLNAYNQVAEEFGFYTSGRPLRTLRNTITLSDALNHNPVDFHYMSQVLTGAVHDFLVELHNWRWAEESERSDLTVFEVSGRALAFAATVARRMMFRGLDYLPPGEISFRDFGRAVLTADVVSNPYDDEFRRFFAETLAARLGLGAADLAVDRPIDPPPPIDVKALMTSDWYAYHVVDTNRELFAVPDDVPFQVEPRRDLTKTTWRAGGEKTDFREILFKVSWEVVEPGRRPRWVRFGTTATFSAEGHLVARVTTNPDTMAATVAEAESAARDDLVNRLLDDDLVHFTPDGAGRPSAVDDGDGLRLIATGRFLHLTSLGAGPPRQVPPTATTGGGS